VGWRLAALLAVVVGWWIIASNFSDERPVRAAEIMGFTQVRLEDSSILFPVFQGCGVGDMKVWYVSGVNSLGERHSFIVCGGILKGDTIRAK
jgi:hypothetical protein